jgi:hypothetical protein
MANNPVTAPAISSNPSRFDHGPVSPWRTIFAWTSPGRFAHSFSEAVLQIPWAPICDEHVGILQLSERASIFGQMEIKDARPHAHMRRPVEILHLRIVWLPNYAKSPPIPDPGITWPIPSARVPSRGVLPLDLNGIGSLSPIFSSLINSSFERLPCIEALSEILRWRGSRCLPQPRAFPVRRRATARWHSERRRYSRDTGGS